MTDEKRSLREEVAELSKAVRELREQLIFTKTCNHCHCWHYYQWPVTTVAAPQYQPYTVTYNNATAALPGSTIA